MPEDLWIRLFQSRFFDEYLALTYIYHKSGGVHEYLCNKLFLLPDGTIDNILAQLCEVAVGPSCASSTVRSTLVNLSTRSTWLALKVQWILHAMAHDDRLSRSRAALTLATKCEEQLMTSSSPAHRVTDAAFVKGALISDHANICGQLTATACSVDQPLSSSSLPRTGLLHTDSFPALCVPPAIRDFDDQDTCERLIRMREQLGRGEGVTALVMSSIVDLNSGGDGVISNSAGMETNCTANGTDLQVFQATIEFFNNLCSCTEGLIQYLAATRTEILQQRLECCNERLSRSRLYAKVLWPMVDDHEFVLRIVCDRARIMNSRERTPILLFVETVQGHDALRFNRAGVEGDLNSAASFESGSDKCAWFDACLEKQSTCCGSQQAEREVQVEGSKASGSHVADHTGTDITSEECCDTASEKSGHGTHKNPSVVALSHRQLLSMNRQEYAQHVYGHPLEDTFCQIRMASPFARVPSWRCRSVILKTGDDCRQELFALQLIRLFQLAFEAEGLPLWLHLYKVLPTGSRAAMIEVLPNAVSVHGIKRCLPQDASLAEHFFKMFPPGSEQCEQAQREFARSLAAYSIVCYILQVKDRHNANIMLDTAGHIMHIDFGFMLTNSPGGVSFERAPFKLTTEYMAILSSDVHGSASPCLQYFKNLWIAGYEGAAKHSENIVNLIRMMSDSGCPCFSGSRGAAEQVQKRFRANRMTITRLFDASADAWSTRQYDYYQRVLNGIF